jgi:uncharacterized membrane protein
MAVLVVGIILFLGRASASGRLRPGFGSRWSIASGLPPGAASIRSSSILTLILLIYGFSMARYQTTVLYTPPVWMAHITFTLMLLALICLAASLLPAGHIATKTKHPMVLSVKIWALAHLLANGDSASVLLFAALSLPGALSCASR